MTSAPATKDDLETAHNRFRDQVRGDLEHALRRQTWRMLGVGVAIAGFVAALTKL